MFPFFVSPFTYNFFSNLLISIVSHKALNSTHSVKHIDFERFMLSLVCVAINNYISPPSHEVLGNSSVGFPTVPSGA